jgi:hypothetical protein
MIERQRQIASGMILDSGFITFSPVRPRQYGAAFLLFGQMYEPDFCSPMRLDKTQADSALSLRSVSLQDPATRPLKRCRPR